MPIQLAANEVINISGLGTTAESDPNLSLRHTDVDADANTVSVMYKPGTSTPVTGQPSTFISGTQGQPVGVQFSMASKTWSSGSQGGALSATDLATLEAWLAVATPDLVAFMDAFMLEKGLAGSGATSIA